MINYFFYSTNAFLYILTNGILIWIHKLYSWYLSKFHIYPLFIFLYFIVVLAILWHFFFFPLAFFWYWILFYFIFINWRLITLQHCSCFCHTLTWISHGFTCIPHPGPLFHLPLHPIPLGLPNAPGLSTCLMHPAWAGDLFHPR